MEQFFTEVAFKNELIKKLNNFRSKHPIYDLDIKVAGGYIYLTSAVCKINQKFEIDFSLSEKTNVRRVRDYLIDFLPVLYELVEVEKSVDEILQGDITEDSILGKHTEAIDRYRVERRLDQYNEILVLDIIDNVLELYKLESPLYTFLQDCFKDHYKASTTFKEKAKFVKELEQRSN